MCSSYTKEEVKGFRQAVKEYEALCMELTSIVYMRNYIRLSEEDPEELEGLFCPRPSDVERVMFNEKHVSILIRTDRITGILYEINLKLLTNKKLYSKLSRDYEKAREMNGEGIAWNLQTTTTTKKSKNEKV